MRRGCLVIVEDNEVLGRSVERALGARFSRVERFSHGDGAVARLGDPAAEPVEVLITDLRLPGADGLAVLQAARLHHPRCARVLMTAHGSLEAATLAMREGAVDFLQKPFELDELEARVEHARAHARLELEVRTLREERQRDHSADRIIGESPRFREALRLAARVAPTRSTVLVTGETGTGKELIAGLVHAASPRAAGPYVKVNCAALPETLLESELFGHERGAFTSADRLRVGRFEQADGGTLFMDEVGDMSLATQSKLLRVLQDQEFQRLGGTTILRTDVRIVAATNRDLEAAIQRGDFREDLYFRLNVITIPLPPLRDRPEDIERLALHFLDEFRADLARPRIALGSDALRRLRAHRWPGNVRELRNVLERAVLMAESDRIEGTDLQLQARPLTAADTGSWQPDLPPQGLLLDDIEAAVVREALDRCAWVQKDAAAFLGVTRRKLNYMIQRIGITHPSWRRNRTPRS